MKIKSTMELVSLIGEDFEAIKARKLFPENRRLKVPYSGSDKLYLNFHNEGVRLSFDRKSKKLNFIGLSIIKKDRNNFIFPFGLPFGLTHPVKITEVKSKFPNPCVERGSVYIPMLKENSPSVYGIMFKKNIKVLFHYEDNEIVRTIEFKVIEDD